jgi:N-acetyl-gamma-glutamyl-phosphate reductase
MTQSVHAAILGASGYGAGELLRLLTQHPAVEVVSATSTSHVGRRIDELHPHLRGFHDLRVSEAVDFEQLLDAGQAVVFSALPHGVSGTAVDSLLTEAQGRAGHDRLRVIDLSGDWRLADAAIHRRFYPETPVRPERRALFVYGLPELFREQVSVAVGIANPGCLAATSILAAAPLVTEEFCGPVVIDAKTGSSGSGRQLQETTHHPTRHANFRAYQPLGHRHEPEILQALGDPHGERVQSSFVAQSMDTARGIYVTLHLTLAEPTDTAAVCERYASFYAHSPFVRVVEGAPELQNVVGSNFCDVGAACRGRQVVVMAALDNLIKGMAGTAIQNMNLMCGLPEIAGLWTPSWRPL